MSSAIRVSVRDALRVILADMDRFYELPPTIALNRAMSRARRLSRDSLTRLRRRAFGTLPSTVGAASLFLRAKFQELKEHFEELENTDIESFSSSDSESTVSSSSVSSSSSSSSSSASSSSSSSSRSSDSQRTVPIDLRRPVVFVPYIDKRTGNLIRSIGSIEF